MSDSDQMRAEFEAWAKSRNLPTATIHWKDGSYSFTDERTAWAYEGYRFGRKAEREEIQKEALQQLVDQAQELDMGY